MRNKVNGDRGGVADRTTGAPPEYAGTAGQLTPAPPGVPARRPTLARVAELAGVSVSTASLAFSGAGPVSDETRTRVLAAAERLQYAGPDPRGRSLRQGRSGIIGIVMEERVLVAFRDPIRIAQLDGIAETTTPGGRGLLLLADAGASAAALETAAMDAVILIGCSGRIQQSVDVIRRRGIPTVAIGGPPFAGVLSVSLDDAEATATAAQHLADLGHRDVAVVTLPLDISGARGDLEPERERESTAQVTLDRLHAARSVFPNCPAIISAGSLVSEGIIAGHSLLDDPTRRPTAVIAQSDLLAAGVIRAAEELGLSVPDDLSVVGFDGIALNGIVPHDLTTMVQPAAEEGRAAGVAALQLLEGEVAEPVRFASRFHRGATTAWPREPQN